MPYGRIYSALDRWLFLSIVDDMDYVGMTDGIAAVAKPPGRRPDAITPVSEEIEIANLNRISESIKLPESAPRPESLEDKLRSYLKLYWLRPENGLLCAFKSRGFEDLPLRSQSLDMFRQIRHVSNHLPGLRPPVPYTSLPKS